MAFRPSDVVGVIWHHPILSGVVLLLFTPPLFPIVVYFSPLLISTALFILAMISMGSDHADSTDSYSSDDIPYKRVWVEEVDVDGPSLDGERVPKRLKATPSKDESWFGKVKNWEGTGRAWVESVLSQEARKSFISKDNAFPRGESIPLLDKARGFFNEDVRKHSRESDYVPKGSSKTIDGAETVLSSNDSAPAVSGENTESVDDQPRAVGVDSGKSISEITPELDSEDELIEISPASIPPPPPFTSKSLSQEDATVNVPVELSKPKDIPSEVPPKVVEAVGSVPGTEDSEDGKETVSASADSAKEDDSIAPVVEQKVVERAPAEVENCYNNAEVSAPSDVSVAKESNVLPREAVGETKDEIKAASSGNSTDTTDRTLAEKAPTNATTEVNSGKSSNQVPSETKSVAELSEPLRQGQQESHGLGTPSAAVALSEKLKVPLADIMSLLAGEDKENVPNEGLSGLKASSSSETTASLEEDWSYSDVESPAPLSSVA